MKVIACENYYQEKMTELHAIDQHGANQEAACANDGSEPNEIDQNIHKIKAATRDALNHLRIKPRRFKTWRFHHAGKQGLRVAKRFGMDALVEISGGCGHIHLWAENLYSDTHWNDRKYLRLLSVLLSTADLVTIEQADEKDRQGQIHIELSYRLVRVYRDGTKQNTDRFLF